MPKKKTTEEVAEMVEAEIVETNEMVKAIAIMNIKYHDKVIAENEEFDLLKEDLEELKPFIKAK